MALSRGRSASRKSSCSLPLLLIVLTIIIQCGLSFVWAWLRKTPIAAGEHVQQQQQQRQQSSPRAPATVIVALRIDQIVLHRMAEPRPCATLDWWPDSKCDFGACSWVNATANSLDLNDPFLVQAAKALAPLTLRLGGSLADQMTYAGIPGSAASPATCDGLDFKPDLRQRVGFTGGCISWRRWLELLHFCSKLQCRFIFGVNAMRGRIREECPAGVLCRTLQSGRSTRAPCCSNYSGSWKPANLRALLRATAAAGHRLAGLSYGNELVTDRGIEAHFAARPYAREMRRFAALVRNVWPAPHTPLLLAPDANHVDEGWLNDFFDELLPPPPPPPGYDGDGGGGDDAGHASRKSPLPPPPLDVDYFAHHMYPLGAGDDPTLHSKLTDPRRLDGAIAERLRVASRIVSNRTGGRVRLAVSETGGAYNSGQRGLTDAFASAFWWLDLLGSLGRYAHDFACRQTLVGGQYGLLDLGRRQPNPDFWATLLHRRLLSPKSLRLVRLLPHAVVNASAPGMASLRAHLRAYAACARADRPGGRDASLDGDASEDSLLNANGGVAAMMINLHPTSTMRVDVEFGGMHESFAETDDPNATVVSRYDYLVTSGSGGLSSRAVMLNGGELRANSDGSIPPLEGEPRAGRVVRLPPLSYGFFVWPEARNSACVTSDQRAEQRRAELQAESKARGGKGRRKPKRRWISGVV